MNDLRDVPVDCDLPTQRSLPGSGFSSYRNVQLQFKGEKSRGGTGRLLAKNPQGERATPMPIDIREANAPLGRGFDVRELL